MKAKKPKVKYTEVIEQTSLAELKEHARIGGPQLASFHELIDELEVISMVVKEQKDWPEPVKKAMYEAVLSIADLMKQSIAIVEHVVTVIRDA